MKSRDTEIMSPPALLPKEALGFGEVGACGSGQNGVAGCCTVPVMPLPVKTLLIPSMGCCIKPPKCCWFAQGAFPGGNSSCCDGEFCCWSGRSLRTYRGAGNSELELASCPLWSLTSSDAVAASAEVASWPPTGPSAPCVCCEQKNVTGSLALAHLPSSPSLLPSLFTWKKNPGLGVPSGEVF